MDKVYIADKTLKQTGRQMPLSFREKIELSRLIDRLEVDSLELPAITNLRVDSLLIKSVASAVRHATVAVPVSLTESHVAETWNALKEAPRARLQISVPVSSVQMEYLYHMKPAAMAARVMETIAECRKNTEDVEFIAEDALRGDPDFMISLFQQVIDAGVRRITIQEAAGTSLPEEMREEMTEILEKLERKEGVIFGVDCSNALSLADACAVETIRGGIREIKAAAFPIDCASLKNLVQVLAQKGEKLGVSCSIRREEIRRVTAQIESLCRANLQSPALLRTGAADAGEEQELSVHDSRESVLGAMEKLGYILSPEDQEKVYQAFLQVAEKKERLSMKELEALIAAEAMQVPPSYQVQRFVINSGNEIGAMAHMKIAYRDQVLEGISTGDGVIDAAFLALEQAIGRHFELDDFQIQAITEGREAMGETIVKLRSQGRLYSGRGLSTDIVGSSIMAYVNALNKIVYEEAEEA